MNLIDVAADPDNHRHMVNMMLLVGVVVVIIVAELLTEKLK